MGQWDVPIVMGCYLVWLGLWTCLLYQAVHPLIGVVAWGVALAQITWHYQLIKSRGRDTCFRAFRMNHWLGFTAFAALCASALFAKLGN
jgi:4-hydroxybenzoate polyprenyltransferase